MDCLSSFFEISGHIVECGVDNTSHPSSSLMVSAAERPERGRTSARSQASSMPQTSSSSSSKNIFNDKKMMARFLGAGMVRTGVTVLMVPDPLPFVDEVIAAALIGAGTGLVMYSES